MLYFVGCVGCVCRRSASGGALVATPATIACGESTAVAGLFNAHLGAAGIIALKAWCIPPA